jgi:hypothetical protein
MSVHLVLFQGLSKERFEDAAQTNLQASQRGAWGHVDAESPPHGPIYCTQGRHRRIRTDNNQGRGREAILQTFPGIDVRRKSGRGAKDEDDCRKKRKPQPEVSVISQFEPSFRCDIK